ncbi:MAG: phosphoribosyltransferase family protein [Desulfurococcaceae archaeon]|uniref:Phosphoribosyltransferase n=1 Tax=Staphylothermus marinus TaxID=2280 RepID=A0A7C4JMW5_STAMA
MKPVEFQYVTWREVVEGCIELASRVKRDGFKPNIILSIVKGGLIPARIIADLLEVDEMCFIGVKFYKIAIQQDTKPRLTFPLTCSVRDKDVLVVDDVVETSRTIQLVVEELSRYGAKRIKTMALYVKKWSSLIPDYYYMMVDKWIVFPWEIVEAVRDGVDISSSIGEDSEIYNLILSKIINQ